ncbi:choice-of-anchor D domain-containing protein [Vulgatibacter incomptus]|uniref:HYDIN/VesB/CFA65-like Ig-like domain-containing protein n=1 Tax=Vulgatibacter incomptus TaxID=1391653 RepID=A0A0K1PHR9_9BACT|nr:choice-of-anchor D domain-containing protein [Vulgatibacter incomptus]AKU93070.1 hypothetical protein AKJ08_3457 [Vulgatibacter incomptus]
MKRAIRFSLLLLAVAALAACGKETLGATRPSIRVTATHVADDGSMLLDFGPVTVLDTRVLNILVQNDGRAPLTLQSASIEGPEGVFSTSMEIDGLRIASGGSVEIPVSFRPNAEEDFEGTFVLHHDDKQKPDVAVRLQGTGSTVGRVVVEPEEIDFGVVGEGMREVRTLTIRSVGTGPLVIDSIELVDSPEAFAFLGSTRPARLPPPADGLPGGAVEIRIGCTPMGEPTELHGTVKLATTDPDRRTVLVPLSAKVNRAPVAVIEVAPGIHVAEAPIGLDGSHSYDPDGNEPLSDFAWEVLEWPLGATFQLANREDPIASLVVDSPGTYEVGLAVKDSLGLECLRPGGDPLAPCARKKIVVKSDIDLVVELVWDHPVTDLDLHLVKDGGQLYSDLDCFWANKTPDWNEIANPVMTQESLKGFGPERIVFPKPAGGRYDVKIEYAKTNGAKDSTTRATVRVFVYGILEAELTRTLDTPKQLWDVLSIDWPAAVLTPIDTVKVTP